MDTSEQGSMTDNNQPQPPTAAERAEGEHDRVEAFADSLEALVSDIVAEAHGSCVAPFTAEYAREQAYDAIHKLQDDKEAAESALVALRAEAEGLRARLAKAERLLREARDWMATLAAQQGRPSKALLNGIDAIDAFLAPSTPRAEGPSRG